jgi:hypothetical protein
MMLAAGTTTTTTTSATVPSAAVLLLQPARAVAAAVPLPRNECRGQFYGACTSFQCECEEYARPFEAGVTECGCVLIDGGVRGCVNDERFGLAFVVITRRSIFCLVEDDATFIKCVLCLISGSRRERGKSACEKMTQLKVIG